MAAAGLPSASGSSGRPRSSRSIANANHVYKAETRAPSTISQCEIVAGYADDNDALAEGLVEAIVGFVTAS